MKFVIPGRLPSLNDYINACRKNKYAGAKFKKDTEEFIRYCIKNAKLQPLSVPAALFVKWYEPNEKRDADNVQSGQKYILDALVSEKILKNDTRRYVKQINHEILTDRKNPRIEVEIKEE